MYLNKKISNGANEVLLFCKEPELRVYSVKHEIN